MRRVAIIAGALSVCLLVGMLFNTSMTENQVVVKPPSFSEDIPMMLWWLPLGATPLLNDLWKQVRKWIQNRKKD